MTCMVNLIVSVILIIYVSGIVLISNDMMLIYMHASLVMTWVNIATSWALDSSINT